MKSGQQKPRPEDEGPDDDALSHLLQGLMGDQPSKDDDVQEEPPPAQGGKDLGSLLQGLVGGMGGLTGGASQDQEEYGAQAETGPAQGGMNLGGLLQGLLGGAGGLAGGASQDQEEYGAQADTGPAQGGMNLGGLLQGILGGAGGLAGDTGQVGQEHGTQAETGPGQGGLNLGGLLQGILGGAGGLGPSTGQAPSSGAGQFGDVLGAVMGGGSSALESDSFLAPIVTGLAEKLGLPPQIAQTVVAFVLGKLMGHRLQPGMETGPAPTRSRAARPQATNLEDVVRRMNSGKRVTKTSIRKSGLAKELAAHTGLDRATAETSLQQVLNALGGQIGAGK